MERKALCPYKVGRGEIYLLLAKFTLKKLIVLRKKAIILISRRERRAVKAEEKMAFPMRGQKIKTPSTKQAVKAEEKRWHFP